MEHLRNTLSVEQKIQIRASVTVIFLCLVAILFIEFTEDRMDEQKEVIANNLEVINSQNEKIFQLESQLLFEKQKSKSLQKQVEELKLLEDQNAELKNIITETLDERYILTQDEYDMMLRLVESEATNEPLQGKIGVANVLVNRLYSDDFPDSIEDIIYQKSKGKYQFSVIPDGRFYDVDITDKTVEAVEKVLYEDKNVVGDSLFFMNRQGSSDKNIKWFDSKLNFVIEIGGHEFFAKK